MTAAAARLHMSTSAISQQISLLEREVALPLLERVGRRVRLNEAGKALVVHYREIAAAVEAAETSLSLFHTDVRGTVTTGAVVAAEPGQRCQGLRLRGRGPGGGGGGAPGLPCPMSIPRILRRC